MTYDDDDGTTDEDDFDFAQIMSFAAADESVLPNDFCFGEDELSKCEKRICNKHAK